MSKWIDFKALRDQLDFVAVLQHYKVEIKRKGDQHHGYCPLPKHQGKRNSPSFSANLKKGIFKCFGCGAQGNVLEFAAYMAGVDPQNGAELRKVAVELQRQFAPELWDGKGETKQTEQKPTPDLPALVNHPLDFQLKGLDAEHPYLKGRGFTPETITYFGLGFCSRGLLKGRVAISLHDQAGQLIGFAGRVVDDKLINEDTPRYRFPGTREREGKLYEFRKTLFLYNGFRIQTPVDDLVVVEGFSSVWWLHQNGMPHVVATMGADCSSEQSELIATLVKPTGRVWIMPDGDTAGLRHAQSLLMQVSPHRFVGWVKLEDDMQPTDIPATELKARFS